jgi:transposase
MNQSTQRVIKNKLGVLNLARELNNIAKACRMMGVSRDTFYRYQAAVEAGGLEALLDTNRRKPNPKNRIDELTEEAVVAHAIECPANGQKRASNELRKAGIFVSPGGVRCIWLRHNLETFKKRLKALEAKIAADGIILTESQMAALERKQEDDVACGEIETHHPGYLGSQDTFYVGHFKGVGRIYQQTYVDTYAKVAFCKLYTNKTPITSADLLNDKVLPFF